MPVARPPEKQAAVLFHWPSPLAPSEIVTVSEGDTCVSMQHGKVLGIFAPGVHQLPAMIPEGVELWFCATRPFVKEKFGGRLPTGGSVFGEYSCRVTAPHLLVPNMAAGGDPDQLTFLLRKTVLDGFIHAFAAQPPSPATLFEATDKAKAAINADWVAIGMKLVDFGNIKTG